MNGRSGESGQPVARRARPGRWRVAVLVLALLGVAVVIALPHVVGHGIRRGLTAAGAGPVALDDVDLNPFTGRLVVRGLTAGSGEAPPLVLERAVVDVSWRALLRRRLLVEQLDVRGLHLLVAAGDGALVIGGISVSGAEPPGEAPTGPAPDPVAAADSGASAPGTAWGVGVASLSVTDSTVRYRVPQMSGEAVIARLALNDLRSWQADRAAALALDATVAGATLAVEARVAPFAAVPGAEGHVTLGGLELAPLRPLAGDPLTELAGRVDVDLDFNATRPEPGAARLSADGGVTLRGLKGMTADADASLEQFTWNGSAALTTAPGGALPGGARVNAEGRVTLRGLKGVTADADASLEHLTWHGGAEFSTAPGGAVPGTARVNAEGGVTLRGLRVVTADAVASLGELAWNGAVAYSAAPGAPPEVRAGGDLSLAGMATTDAGGTVTLAAADGARLDGVAVRWPGDATLAAFTVNGLAILRAGEGEPLFRAGGVTATDAAFRSGNRLTVAAVEVADAWAVLRRLPGGALHPLDALPRRARADAPGPAPPAGAGGTGGMAGGEGGEGTVPFTFALGRLTISGDSGARFDDQGVSPAYRLRAAIREARVEKLDSAAPGQPSPVALRVDLGEYATITLAGTVLPFADRLNLDLTGQLKALELPPLSAYSAAATGYNVHSGALDADLRLRVTDGAIDGETVLRLHQLALAAASPERTERLARELTMPLDAALSLLRDKRDTIKLTVPLSGSVDDPQFELGKVVNKAIAGATRKAALSYLKYALQPYGTLISVAQMAAGAAGAIALDPVLFAAGDASPPQSTDGYLEKVAGLLADRAGLSLKACGRAVAADRLTLPARRAPDVVADPAAVAERVAAAARGEAVAPEPATDAELLELARARADAVKARLVTAFGVAPERVFVCNPTLDADAAAAPRVELRI